MVESEALQPNESSGWTWWRFIVYTAIIGIVYSAGGILAFIFLGVAYAITIPEFDIAAWANGADSDGFVFSVVIFAAMSACLPAVRFLTARREKHPWDFLGFRRCPARHVALSCVVLVVFVIATGFLGTRLGRPEVPQFLVEWYTSAGSPTLLFVVLVVAVPFFEELLCRGFLFGVLRACGSPLAVTVIVVSVVFAALHTQYDAYDVTITFLLGLLFIGARVRFDSVVPSIAMHSLTNAMAFVGVLLSQRGGA